MNITELVQACRTADDIEVAAAQLINQASPAARKQMAAKWLAEEARRLNRDDVLGVERRTFKVRMYRTAREEQRSAAERSARTARQVGPSGHRARRRWLAETVEGQAHAAREAQFEAEMRELQRQRREELQKISDRWAEMLRAEWTQELLDSGFALPDGRVILWGDATIEQHEARCNQFMDNAQANLEGAARHQAAIKTLRESGAATLREMDFAEAS